MTRRLPAGTRSLRVMRWSGQFPPVPFLVEQLPQGRQIRPRLAFHVWRIDQPRRRPGAAGPVAIFRAWAVPLPMDEAAEHSCATLPRVQLVRDRARPRGVPGRIG
ncbi:hypothetical protein MHL39_10675 [Roseomonas mucosa]|uniref:hypothetical protein n=1 Tax=Roseomonas mucosa TaxID=207340 RepID=UPI001EF727D9|nr:hypothetical protein [Roseomonas mucosa]MCG7357102.1 hypothetical protein [Roseomonas mucosa]